MKWRALMVMALVCTRQVHAHAETLLELLRPPDAKSKQGLLRKLTPAITPKGRKEKRAAKDEQAHQALLAGVRVEVSREAAARAGCVSFVGVFAAISRGLSSGLEIWLPLPHLLCDHTVRKMPGPAGDEPGFCATRSWLWCNAPRRGWRRWRESRWATC
jgi:hypothetical protein